MEETMFSDLYVGPKGELTYIISQGFLISAWTQFRCLNYLSKYPDELDNVIFVFDNYDQW